MRYAATLVMVLFVVVRLVFVLLSTFSAFSFPSAVPFGAEMFVKGSVISWEGEVMGVGSVEGMALDVDARFGACRADRPADGDARRDKVLRNVDLRLGGGAGSVEASIGSLGSLALGYASRSFWCSSTISFVVLVSVRLWVGAGGKYLGQK